MMILLSLWIGALVAPLPAQQVQQAKILFDINAVSSPSPSDPNPGPWLTLVKKKKLYTWGSSAFFQASRFDTGFELWTSDGTNKGTRLIKDIYPGITSSFPRKFCSTHDGSLVFFVAMGKGTGFELHVTDGTAAGTHLVADLSPGVSEGGILEIAPFSGKQIMFTRFSLVGGATELWVSDGTKKGTYLIMRHRMVLNTAAISHLYSPSSSSPVFFTANINGSGWEPWISDGTAKGTNLLKDIRVGTGSSGPAGYIQMSSGRILFAANDGVSGNELWITDGTSKGTKLLLDLEKGSASGVQFFLEDRLGSTVFFVGSTKKAGDEIYATDGTVKGTTLLVDAWPGSSSGYVYPARLVSSGVVAFFAARAAKGKVEIYRTGGTPTSTVKITPRSLASIPISMTGLLTDVYFEATDLTPGTGRELCVIDAKGMRTFNDLNKGSAGGRARFLTRIGSTRFLFTGESSAQNTELYSYDLKAGIVPLDINHRTPAITKSSRPYSAIPLGSKLLIFADDGVNGREPWISDGKNTKLLKDIMPGKAGSDPRYPCVLGDKVLFQATDPKLGVELYITDGTRAGTSLLKDAAPGKASLWPGLMTTVGKRVYFVGSDSTGLNPWVSDGTSRGTHRLANVLRRVSGARILGFAGYGNKVAFLVDEPISGAQLWFTDGTSKGTRKLQQHPKGRRGWPARPIAMGGRVYYVVDQQLYVTDFTVSGTKAIDLTTAGITRVHYHVTNGERLYLSAWSKKHGNEVFVSDGTSKGTRLFIDLAPGPVNSDIRGMEAVGSRRLYFTSLLFRGLGYEHHRSDGTGKGTISYDVYPGSLTPFWSALSFPHLAPVIGGRVYFAPNHPTSGSEIFYVDNGATATSIGSSYGGTWLTGSDPVLGGQAVLRGGCFRKNSVHVAVLGFPPVKASPFAGAQWLHVDPLRFWTIAFVASGARFGSKIPIPNLPSLKGGRLALQVLSLDPGLGSQVPRLSNGLDWTLGQ